MNHVVQVFGEFQEYARDYPLLGMTIEEFREFLIDRQDVG